MLKINFKLFHQNAKVISTFNYVFKLDSIDNSYFKRNFQAYRYFLIVK